MSTENSSLPRAQAVALFVAALVVAGGTAWFAHRVIGGYRSALEAVERDTREVVVATRDIGAGESIPASALSVEKRQVVGLPPEALFAAVDAVATQYPSERILAGEIVRKERLSATVGGGAQLSSVVPPGERAVTVVAERAHGLGGLLTPGERVDVIVTIRPDSNALGADWVTETILQDARVLAVGTTILGSTDDDNGKESPRVAELVTLAASPMEAEMLALGASRGELHLALRGQADSDTVQNRGPLVTNALVGIQGGATTVAPTRSAPARRAASTVAPSPRTTGAEVIEGVRTSVQSFDEGGGRVVEPSSRKRNSK